MALKFNEATSIESMILSEWPTLIFEEICREGLQLQDFDMNTSNWNIIADRSFYKR